MPRPGMLSAVAFVALAALVAVPTLMQWRRRAAEPAPWIGQTADDGNGFSLHYEVLLPANFHLDQRYPVVLYLHQLDMGNNRAALRRQVDGWFDSTAFRARHPAIIVVPMLDQRQDPGGRVVNFGGKQNGQAGEAAAIAALRQVIVRYPVDAARIYVTGNSMGGMGTWELLLSYNARTGTRDRIFAAGMPLAGRHGTADPAAAAQALRHVPIWAIHGARDPEVSPAWDRGMAALLADSGRFRYTEDPALAHNVWDGYYPRAELWDWLFAQAGPAVAAVRSTSANGTPPAGSGS